MKMDAEVVKRLISKIKINDVDSVKALLDEGCNLATILTNSPYEHPMQLAIELHNLEIISLLLQYDFCINAPIKSSGQRALHCAVLTRNMKIINEILKLNADWTAVDADNVTAIHLLFLERSENSMETTTMILGRQKEIIQILKVFLNNGVDVNAEISNGETLLFLAVKYDMKEVAEFLIRRGAHLDVCDNDGNTLAHLIVKKQIKSQRLFKCEDSDQLTTHISMLFIQSYGEIEVESDDQQRKNRKDAYFLDDLLHEGMNADLKNKANELPLQLALQHKLLPLLPVLIKHTKNLQIFNDSKETIFHVILKMLDVEDVQHDSPMIKNKFIKEKSIGVVDPFSKDSVILNIVKILLSRGLSADKADADKNTPLIIAAKLQKLDIVEALLSQPLNVNFCDKEGNTALHYIVERNLRQSLNVISMLMSQGADLSKPNYKEETPTQVAVRCENVAAYIHLNQIEDNSDTLEDLEAIFIDQIVGNVEYQEAYIMLIRWLLSQDRKMNALKIDNKTPLIIALEYLDTDVLPLLISKGADVNFKHYVTGWTALHYAVQDCEVEYLLSIHLYPNTTNMPSRTNQAEVCKKVIILLQAGAEVDVEDRNGLTPMFYCVKFSFFDVMTLLLEYGAGFHSLGDLSNKVKYLVECDSTREYLMKLKIAKLSTSQFEGFAVPSLRNHDRRPQSLSSAPQCLLEIRRLKRDAHERITLYDFLHMSRENRVWFAPKITSYLKSSEFYETYPKYRNIIWGKYYRAMETRVLLEKAKNAMIKLTERILPDDFIEQTISMLDNFTLRRIITAATLKKRSMSKVAGVRRILSQ